MNVVAATYKAVRDRIVANTDIKFFDLWNNQTEYEELELPFPRPAAFFEYVSMPADRLGNKRYQLNCTFNIHLVSDLIQESSSAESTVISDAALEHLNLIGSLLYWMDNFQDDTIGFGSICYNGLQQFDSNKSDIVHHILQFSVRMVDDSAKHKMTPVDPAIHVTVEKQ